MRERIGRSRRRARVRPPRDQRDDEFFDDLDDDGDTPRSRRRGRGRSAGTRRTGERSREGGGFDWDATGEAGESGAWEAAEPAAARREPSARAEARPRRATLMDLCMPVFGYAAILPRGEGDEQPDYESFRRQVVTSLNRLESEAPEHGIEAADARQASYALSLLLDSQIAESAWDGRSRWAGEPLHIMIHQDAEGGVNFFRRLEGFGDRERAVKEVFLVCLALGFRGQYADLEATQQAARIGEIRQRLLRSIHPVPLESRGELFPEAYREAEGLEDDMPPPPRSWLVASLSIAGVALLLWVVLFLVAGRLPERARERVGAIERGAAATPEATTPVAVDPETGGAS